MGYTPSKTQSGYEAGELVQTDPNFGEHGVETPGSVPFPMPSPGFFGPAGARDSSTGTQSEAGDQDPTSPYVAPLQDRAAPLRGLNDSSGSQNDPTSVPSSGVSSSDPKVGYPGGFTSTASSPTSQHPLPPIPLGRLAPTEFRRHTDAGEIPDQGQERGVVDLSPLYTDVPARRAVTQQEQQ